MKRIDGLFEKVVSFGTLWTAVDRAAKGKRERPEVQRFLWEREAEVLRLQEELREGRYQPRPMRHFWICDPKARRISAAAFRDRVVHHALCGVIEPSLEAYATADSYACRKEKGSIKALEAARNNARRFAYVLKLDIERFFESVDHDVLQKTLERKFQEKALHGLFRTILAAPLQASPQGKGLPIGNLTSQHFANFYLGRLDHAAKEEARLGGYVRYMDDILCFADKKETLWEAFLSLKNVAEGELKVAFKRAVTRLCPISEGVRFLGFHVTPERFRWTAERKKRFCRGFRDLRAGISTGRLSEEEAASSGLGRLGHSMGTHTLSFRRKFFAALEREGAER